MYKVRVSEYGGMDGSRCFSNILLKIKIELLIKFYNGDLFLLEWWSVNIIFNISIIGVYIYICFFLVYVDN